MRKLWIRSLALSLGLAVTGARGQEGGQTAQAPAASLGKPVAIATSRQAAPAAPAAAASLGRPIAISATPVTDANLQPASFSPRRPVARGSAPEGVPHRPMPVGPTDMGGLPAPGMHSWRTAEGVVASTVSRNGGEAAAAPPPPPASNTLVAPTPVTPAPVAPAPIVSPGAPLMNSPGTILPPSASTPAGPFPPPTVIGGAPGAANGVPPIAFGPTAGPNSCMPNCGPTTCGPSCCSTGGCAAATGAWGGCGGCGCCDGPMFVIGAEFLLWWIDGDQTPPLVSIGPAGQSPPVLGAGRVVSGGERMADNVRPGGRLTGIWWFSDAHCWGLDASAFFLGNAENGRFNSAQFGTSNNAVSVGRPFFSSAPITSLVNGTTIPPIAATEDVVSPNLNGFVTVDRQSNLWGADVNLRRNVWCGECLRFDLLGGARILGLDESLTINENLTVVMPRLGETAGDVYLVTDRFSTQNRFYGGQIGFDSEYRYGAFSLGVRSKLGLGVTHQTVQIAGNTLYNGTTIRNVEGQQGGLLANGSTNAGSFSRSMFSVVPEVGLTLGYNVFDWWRITAGYNYLVWTNVARPGEQIDQNVNFNLLPTRGAPVTTGPTTPRDPARTNANSNLNVHGVSLGMQFMW